MSKELRGAKLGDEGVHEEKYSGLPVSNTFIHGPWQFRQRRVLEKQRLAKHQPEAIAGVELLKSMTLLAAFGLWLRGDELMVH